MFVSTFADEGETVTTVITAYTSEWPQYRMRELCFCRYILYCASETASNSDDQSRYARARSSDDTRLLKSGIEAHRELVCKDCEKTSRRRIRGTIFQHHHAPCRVRPTIDAHWQCISGIVWGRKCDRGRVLAGVRGNDGTSLTFCVVDLQTTVSAD